MYWPLVPSRLHRCQLRLPHVESRDEGGRVDMWRPLVTLVSCLLLCVRYGLFNGHRFLRFHQVTCVFSDHVSWCCVYTSSDRWQKKQCRRSRCRELCPGYGFLGVMCEGAGVIATTMIDIRQQRRRQAWGFYSMFFRVSLSTPAFVNTTQNRVVSYPQLVMHELNMAATLQHHDSKH